MEEKSEERRDSGGRVTSNTRIPASETRGWRGGRFPCQPWREGHRRVPRWGRRPPLPLTVEPFGLEEEELSKTGPVTSYL